MFAPEATMLITSMSAMLALVGASGIGYAAGSRSRKGSTDPGADLAGATDSRSRKGSTDPGADLAGATDSRSRKSSTDPGAAPRSPGAFAGRESAAPQAAPASSRETDALPAAPQETDPERIARKRRIEQRAAEARMLAGPAVAAPVEGVELLGPRRPRVINDHLAIERFLQFMRDCGARTLPAEDADDIATSSADDGSLAIMAALIADPLLAVDWMTTEELAEIYVAWCRVKGYVPMAEGALLPEIVHAAGVTRDRRRLKGAAFVRIRDRYAQRGIDKERATIVRVWSTEEMAARDRQRAGEARRDQIGRASCRERV